MKRLESYECYLSSAYAYFKFLYESYNQKPSKEKSIILEENYVIGAKIAFLANILTGIKEDIVSKENGYSPKVILQKLEETVNTIARQTFDGYVIDGYKFNSASEVVAVIRNKLAHGKYFLDLENNQIIFQMDNQDISLNIKQFSKFVVNAIGNYLNDQSKNKQVRNITYVEPRNIYNIRTESAIRGLIKRIHTKTFEIKTKDGSPLSPVTKKAFDNLVNLYKKRGDEVLSLKEYRDICRKLEEAENIEFIVSSKPFNYTNIEKIVPEIKTKIFDDDSMTIEQKIRSLLNLLEKNNKLYENKFSNLVSNFNNLLLIDIVESAGSVDNDVINDYFAKKYSDTYLISSEEFIVSIIAMFNPLFQYLFDEIYVKPGEYTSDRSDYFDFSKVDTSLIKDKNMFYTISEKTYLENLKARLNGICSSMKQAVDKLNKQNDNLSKIDPLKQTSSKAVNAIKQDISRTTIKYNQLKIDKSKLEAMIDYVDKDLNSDYFKNKSIIEGIRNSISHGNYEVKMNYDNAFDSLIIFKDIYEGKETFKLEIKAYDFMQFILTNVKEPTLFVQSKLDNKKKTY